MTVAVQRVNEGVGATLLAHFLALPTEDRCLRFGTSLPPGVIAACVDGIDFDPDAVFGVHALAANGFGDAATTETASSARPSSYQLHQAARAHRSFTLGEIIVAAIQAAGAIARRAHARHRQRRQARVAYDLLRQLDDRTLRDLGFDRSEIASVAAELTGEAEYTRVRALLTSHRLPK